MSAGSTLVMGILNVTPDSFSDGGHHQNADAAVAHALRMSAEGADIIDIGGESTRPGADPVEPALEQQRILPVLERLLTQKLRLSVDTRHATTARAVLEMAGDRVPELIINDVSGLLTEPQMPSVVAEYGCEIVLTHNRGDSKTMQQLTEYGDLLEEVISELLQVRQRYLDAGVPAERIILDPGIGFAKTHRQNWELIGHLHRIAGLGHRMLFGVSRKGLLGALLADASGQPRPAAERDTATAALSLVAAQAGAWAVRVHEPQPSADALKVLTAVEATEGGYCA